MLLLFDTCDDISQSLELDERFIKGLDAGLSIDLVKVSETVLIVKHHLHPVVLNLASTASLSFEPINEDLVK